MGGAHHRGPHLDHRHHFNLQEGTSAPTFSPLAEKSKSASTHPHHLLQGNHWERTDQLRHWLSGTATVVQQTARPSSGQWTQLQKSSVPLSLPSWIFSLHEAPAKPIVSWRNPPILSTVSSSSYHQEDGTGALEPALPDCSTAFTPRLWEPWTQIITPHPTSLGAFPLHDTAQYGSVRFPFGGFSTRYCTWYLVLF